MGILNRTPDSFYDRGATWSFDAFLRRAEELIDRRRRPPRRRRRQGRARARGRRGGGARPGRARDRRAARAVRRPDLRRHVARVGARRRVRRGRGRRQRHLRVRRSRLPRRSRPRTTRRSSPRTSGCARASPIPNPHYDDLVGDVDRVPARAGAARRVPPASSAEQIVLDAGLDLGKTPAQSAVLLRESAAHAGARLPAAALGVEQAVHRRAPRPRDRRPAGGVARGGRVRRRVRLPDRPRARRARQPARLPDARSHALGRGAASRRREVSRS